MAALHLQILHFQFPISECHLGEEAQPRRERGNKREREPARTHTLIFAWRLSFQEPQLIIINLIRDDSESS